MYGRAGIISILLVCLIVPIALAQEEITLATADTEPYSTIAGYGFYDILLTTAFTRLGMDLSIVHLPSERSIVDAAAGVVDGEFGRTPLIGELYSELLIVPEALSQWDFSAFVRTGAARPKSFQELAQHHVAYIRGWKIFEDNLGETRSATPVATEQELFSMLTAGHIEVALYNRTRGLSYLRRNGITGIEAVQPPLASAPMHLFLHRRWQALVEPLNEVLREMKDDGSYQAIARQTLGEE